MGAWKSSGRFWGAFCLGMTTACPSLLCQLFQIGLVLGAGRGGEAEGWHVFQGGLQAALCSLQQTYVVVGL